MESIATHVLLRWINSCTTEEHIASADRLVSLFLKMYGATENYTVLCNALQLVRIDVFHMNAVNI